MLKWLRRRLRLPDGGWVGGRDDRWGTPIVIGRSQAVINGRCIDCGAELPPDIPKARVLDWITLHDCEPAA